jgi:hypothetical protein
MFFRGVTAAIYRYRLQFSVKVCSACNAANRAVILAKLDRRSPHAEDVSEVLVVWRMNCRKQR